MALLNQFDLSLFGNLNTKLYDSIANNRGALLVLAGLVCLSALMVVVNNRNDKKGVIKSKTSVKAEFGVLAFAGTVYAVIFAVSWLVS